MRARNIKPGFFKNEDLLECDPLARILFAGLWCMADREGRLEDRPKKIKIEILPCDNCDVDILLHDLEVHGLIIRYDLNDQSYIEIPTFLDHQRPHVREEASLIPPSNTIQAQPRHNLGTGQPALNPESPSLNPECSSTEEDIPPKKSKNNYSNEFEVFWKAYPPNGASKSEGFKSWVKVIGLLDQPAVIIAAVEPYRAYAAASNTPIAHATTWLNQKRWEVDYPELTKAAKTQINGQKPMSFEQQAKRNTDLAIEEASKRYANPS